MGKIIGIDLGTTNSAAAVFDGERISVVRTTQGTLLTPSIVRYDSRGALTIGAKAAKFLDSDPKNTRSEFKRLMGTSSKLDFPAAKLARLPEELSAEVLRSLRNDVKDQYGFLPEQAVISVPALFELPQSAATTKAALLNLSNRFSIAVERLRVGDYASVRVFKDSVREALELFLRFNHRYWFHEVSNQAQAKDLFRMLTGHLDTDRIYQDVSEAVREMNQYLDSDGLRRQANTVVRLTVVTTLGLIATVLTGFLGMNIFDYASESFWIKLLIVMGVLTPTILLVFYGVAKSKVLSDFLEALSDERLALRDKLGVLFKVWEKRPPNLR